MSTFLEILMPEGLLERARSGEKRAQEELYTLFSRAVYSLIRRLVSRPAIAEELLHDVFVQVLRNLPSFNGSGAFAGWVRSVAVSAALMHLRSPWQRRALWATPDGLLELPDERTAATEDLRTEELERALERLPVVTRSVVWLHDVEGYTHEEIAQLYRRSKSFSKSQLARGHEQLRELLESDPGALPCTPPAGN